MQALLDVAMVLYGFVVAGFYGLLGTRTIGPVKRSQVYHLPKWSATESPFVSVIVPARNEARGIRACIESLLCLDYPAFEVIVVDDGSADATPAILSEIKQQCEMGSRLQVIRIDHLPDGWYGKPHALHVGVQVARGDWFLFTDADTIHAADSLRTVVHQAQERHIDLLSLITLQETPDFWGRVLMPLAYLGVSWAYPLRKIHDPRSTIALANGQYILTSRRAYERTAGYAARKLRTSVVDDRDYADAVKRIGGKVAMLDGRSLVRTRMYQGFQEYWDGWSKNAYAASQGGPVMYALQVLGLPMFCILPFLLIVLGLLAHRPWWTLGGSVSTLAILLYRLRVNRDLSIPTRYIWTHPLAGGVFAGILIRSGWAALSGRGVPWRNRRVLP